MKKKTQKNYATYPTGLDTKNESFENETLKLLHYFLYLLCQLTVSPADSFVWLGFMAHEPL